MDPQIIEEGFQKVWRMFQETDRQFKETGQRFQETDQRFQETDQRFQEAAQRSKEIDDKFDKYFGKVKELDRNWGKLVEALVKPSVGEQFRKWGIPVHGSGQRVEVHKGGETMEIDILLKNEDALIVVEVKTTLTVAAVNEHIEKRLKPFKRFFPEYRDRTVYGAAAYIHVEENADRYAYKNGLFVLTFAAGDMVEIQNDDRFEPRVWGAET